MNKSIVFIDDDIDVINLYKKFMKDVGFYDAHFYIDPVEAYYYVQLKKGNCIVFLDIHMPEIDGLRFSENITQEYPNLEIIFISSEKMFKHVSFSVGGSEFFQKPINSSKLQHLINKKFC